MKITIKNLHVTNFKGLRNRSFAFADDITNIYGANGTGKTTICDAIQWCLFGKSSTGSTNFSIKTRNADGSVTPNEEHSVTLTLCIDGIDRIVKRKFVEVWESVRGAEPTLKSHKTEYYVDGEKYTKSDYEKFISSIIEETTFRIITSPTYFFSLKWQEQRTILQQLAGNVTAEEINANGEFNEIDDILHTKQFASVEAYLQHLSYNINEIKKQLDVIPARIEEQRTTMPEALDFDAIKTEVESLQETLNRLYKEQSELKDGKEDATRQMLRKQIDFSNVRIGHMTTSAQMMSAKESEEHNERVNTQMRIVTDIEQKILQLTSKISSCNTIAEQIHERQVFYDNEVKTIRAKWSDMSKMQFSTSNVSDSCPTCGAPLSADTYQQALQKAHDEFTKNKENIKAELNEWASRVKSSQAEASAELASINDTIKETENVIAEQKVLLATEQQKLNEYNSEKPKTAQQLLEINPSYKDCLAKIEECEKALAQSTPAIDPEDIATLNKAVEDAKAMLNEKQRALGIQQVIEIHKARLAELEELQSSLTRQLDSLESKRDVALDYQFRACDLLEDKVNQHFHTIRFTMFKEYLNTNREPWCSAEKDGVPYTDINAASKLNAGLEVCAVIGKFFGKQAPIVIDNAESVNDILATGTQQIRLYVSQDKELIIQ